MDVRAYLPSDANCRVLWGRYAGYVTFQGTETCSPLRAGARAAVAVETQFHASHLTEPT